LPARDAVHETVAAPDPVTLAGLIAPQVSPAGTVSESSTVPEKWFRADTVRVDVLDAPAFPVTSEVVVIVKSRNWKSDVAECTRIPLVPVSVRV
jgi:hypothetical protein